MKTLIAGSLVLIALTGPVLASDPGDEFDVSPFRKHRHTWTGEETPLTELGTDPGRDPETVTSAEAAADVDRLFSILEHGWSGFAYFDGDDRFARAKVHILEGIERKRKWEPAAFAELIRHHLSFVRDCHTSIGGVKYGVHRDWWFDAGTGVRRVGDRFEMDGEEIVSIGGAPPGERLFRSLDDRGAAVWRIGVLSAETPEPLVVVTRGGSFVAPLQRSEFRFFTRRLFREDRVGGIPVLRIRTFSDHHESSLRDFVAAAGRLRSEACVIVDVRGNGGGNERWVNAWVRAMTGATPSPPFVFSELVSRTSTMGRANYMAWLHHHNPGTEFYGHETEQFTAAARRFEPGGIAPYWTPLRYREPPRIPNSTTIVIVTNGLVGSAGEGFVIRTSQAENVVVVGENTLGALTFGNVSAHQLPNSGLMVRVPINFGFFPDGVFREETGLMPDWWVPAADAVNAAVLAVRSGTIKSARPLTAKQRAAEFVPEKPGIIDRLPRWAPIPVAGLGFVILTRLVMWWVRRRKNASA